MCKRFVVILKNQHTTVWLVLHGCKTVGYRVRKNGLSDFLYIILQGSIFILIFTSIIFSELLLKSSVSSEEEREEFIRIVPLGIYLFKVNNK